MHLLQQVHQLQQVLETKARPAGPHGQVWIRWRQTRPASGERGPVTAGGAVEDALFSPLVAAGDDVERLSALRMKGMSDANRIGGHLGWARCSL